METAAALALVVAPDKATEYLARLGVKFDEKSATEPDKDTTPFDMAGNLHADQAARMAMIREFGL